MRLLLLFFGKLINNLFGYSMQNHKYFQSWKYIYNIGLMGMGRIQGNPIEKDGEIDVIKKVITASGDKVIILDVGANKGQYATHVMNAAIPGKQIELHIFEPSGSNMDTLHEQFNLEKYPAHRFFVNKIALSDANAEEFLYADEEGSDLGSLINLKTSVRPFDDSKKEKVTTMTLDHYFEKNNLSVVDFIKIDVEGAEYKVLSGALTIIKENRIKYIQFEFGAGNISSRIFFLDFWELLSDKYEFYQVLSGGLIPIKAYSSDLEIFKTTNYLLVLNR